VAFIAGGCRLSSVVLTNGELSTRENTRMKLNQSKHDAGGKLKNGVFKEFFKDGTSPASANTAMARESASGSTTCGTECCGPWANSPPAK
jgi:hypothetical protein